VRTTSGWKLESLKDNGSRSRGTTASKKFEIFLSFPPDPFYFFLSLSLSLSLSRSLSSSLSPKVHSFIQRSTLYKYILTCICLCDCCFMLVKLQTKILIKYYFLFTSIDMYKHIFVDICVERIQTQIYIYF